MLSNFKALKNKSFSNLVSKNFCVISNKKVETKVKYRLKQAENLIGKYTVFDHEYDAVVVGAGGAGLRVILF